MENHKNIYEVISERCEALGLTLYETCRLVNMPYETLRSWRKKEPKSLKDLRKVGDFLGVKNVFDIYSAIQTHLETHSLYSLANASKLQYEKLQRWLRWKGLPKSLQTLSEIDLFLTTKEQNADA